MTQKQHVMLACSNDDQCEAPYQMVLHHDKPIRRDYYVSRNRAARECYRQRRNFMRFLLENPSQRDADKIDSNSLLTWLGLSPCAEIS
jgi:hypothetical protein